MDYNNMPEGQVLALLQKQDEGAIDFIFNKYKTMVSSISRRYFLVGAEQEDLLQEGMLGLYKACVSYVPKEGSAKFSAYAYICISRSIQTAVKKANKLGNFALNTALSLSGKPLNANSMGEFDQSETILYLPSPEPTPENKLIEKENYMERVAQIKEVLSAYEYEVLAEYLKGYKCDDIAKKLGKDYKSIDNAINRIKSKLQFLKDTN